MVHKEACSFCQAENIYFNYSKTLAIDNLEAAEPILAVIV